jgi:hypothetical protein
MRAAWEGSTRLLYRKSNCTGVAQDCASIYIRGKLSFPCFIHKKLTLNGWVWILHSRRDGRMKIVGRTFEFQTHFSSRLVDASCRWHSINSFQICVLPGNNRLKYFFFKTCTRCRRCSILSLPELQTRWMFHRM